MQASDQTLATRAAEYFSARDIARKEDRRAAKQMDAIRDRCGAFEYEGKEVYSLAHLETMRPAEPMTPEEMQDAIERLQRGNARVATKYPAKLLAFEQAMSAARAHFEALDATRKAAGIADDDDPRWQAIEVLEIGAWSARVSTLGDISRLLRLLQDHLAVMGNVDDFVIEGRLVARLREAIAILERGQ